jgi:hypothetical protein
LKRFFIRKEKLTKILLISLVVFNLFPYYLTILWCLFIVVFFYIHRKNNVDFKEVINLQPDVVLSPIDGTKIRIALPWNRPFGLFMPISGTISNIEKYDGDKLNRFKSHLKFTNGYSRHNLTITSKSGNIVYLELLDCLLGRKPKTWVEAGDKGRLASCIGFFPFGGTAVITLPRQSEVFCKVGDKLRAGETVLSGLKE